MTFGHDSDLAKEALITVGQGFRCCCCDLPVLRRDGPCAKRSPERYAREAAEVVRLLGERIEALQ
jgi:hypothetical protein